jgi:predicted Zn-dependent peptidase
MALVLEYLVGQAVVAGQHRQTRKHDANAQPAGRALSGWRSTTPVGVNHITEHMLREPC